MVEMRGEWENSITIPIYKVTNKMWETTVELTYLTFRHRASSI